jgi:hypothetical protein
MFIGWKHALPSAEGRVLHSGLQNRVGDGFFGDEDWVLWSRPQGTGPPVRTPAFLSIFDSGAREPAVYPIPQLPSYLRAVPGT